jgi:hypothetical protein
MSYWHNFSKSIILPYVLDLWVHATSVKESGYRIADFKARDMR